MNYGKYIIVLEREHLTPILFGNLISHDTFLQCYTKSNILSAGFFRTDGDDIITFGESTILDKTANDGDGSIIKKIIQGY